MAAPILARAPRDDAPSLQPREALRAAFDATVATAQPERCLPRYLPHPPRGRTLVVGAGKASAAMAAALEAHWPRPLSGIVLTRRGHAVPTREIEIVEAGHPVPDEAGLAATSRIRALLGEAGPDDLVIGLFSGGGSSLLCAPAGGMTLSDKQAVNRALLASGAPIDAMNVVRKHLSLVKGGRLAALAGRSRIVSLIMSDVPGDDMATIASGPTVGDSSTAADALAIVERYRIPMPAAALAWLEAASGQPESAPELSHVTNTLVMTPAIALGAAADLLRERGFEVLYLGDDIEGEAREVGADHARFVRRLSASPRPLVVLSGGETTVTMRGPAGGRGGRNTEYLLALALGLEGMPGVTALAADTDGIDGSEDNAGALFDAGTLARARAAGLDPEARLAANDAYAVFAASGDLLMTGPTHTNVNDFRAILIPPRR